MSPTQAILNRANLREPRFRKTADATPAKADAILRLAHNKEGRDFAVGDIHGCFELLTSALELAQFNQSCDRLLCVGDLIDRGPASHQVLDFLAQPFVYAVQGNHEYMFCQKDPSELRALAKEDFNGLKWVERLKDKQIKSIQERLAKLPLVMEVQTAVGLIGLVHAEVPPDMHWSEFVQRIEDYDQLTVEFALNSRMRFRSLDTTDVPGIERVFVGHNVCWDGPEQRGNLYVMDTGAGYAAPFKGERRARSRGFLSLADICSDDALLAISYHKSIQPSSRGEDTETKVSGIRMPFEQIAPTTSAESRDPYRDPRREREVESAEL